METKKRQTKKRRSKEPQRRLEQMRRATGIDPARLPPAFKKILAEELQMLRLPRSILRYPFRPVSGCAHDTEYIVTGIGDYLFDDVDYALIRYLFGVTDPGKVSKDLLRGRLAYKAPSVDLQNVSWPTARGYLLADIEAERRLSQSDKHTGDRAEQPWRDDVPYSPRQIAEKFGLPFGALRKRLERLRKCDLNCFIEVDNRTKNEPRYLYKLPSVQGIIEQMKKLLEKSSPRPT